jgi:hypothetical protein
MSDEVRTPDAVQFPQGLFPGNLFERVGQVHERFGPVLGIEKGWIRPAGPRQPLVFYSPNLDDTIYFPTDHPTLAGEPRYTWKQQPDGAMYGYLVEGA